MLVFLLVYKNTFGSHLNFFTIPEQQNSQLKDSVSLSLFIGFFFRVFFFYLIFERNIVTDSFRWLLISPPDCFITVPYDTPQDGFPTIY